MTGILATLALLVLYLSAWSISIEIAAVLSLSCAVVGICYAVSWFLIHTKRAVFGEPGAGKPRW
jgi:hypothetical protein